MRSSRDGRSGGYGTVQVVVVKVGEGGGDRTLWRMRMLRKRIEGRERGAYE